MLTDGSKELYTWNVRVMYQDTQKYMEKPSIYTGQGLGNDNQGNERCIALKNPFSFAASNSNQFVFNIVDFICLFLNYELKTNEKPI